MQLHLEWNRVLSRPCLACTLFVIWTSLASAQNSPLGPKANFEPQLPRQSAAPVPAMQLQPTSQSDTGNPFLGSTPQGTATAEELPLSLPEAVARGLRYNLGSLLADQSARATRDARRAAHCPQPRENKIDYVGFGFLAIGVAFLQIVLDKGQEDDWFGSEFILLLSVVSVICLVSLVIWELHVEKPILDFRLFKNGNFANSCLMMFMVGAASFSTTVLMPQFLQSLMGYTAETAGMVLSAAAIILLIELPLVGQLTSKIQARYLMAFGWAVLTISMFASTRRIDLQISFVSATWLRIAQYVPMGFIFIPATMVAYLGIPQDKSNAVAGWVNFVRNMGSSVGTSAVTTILARRAQVHQVMLANHTGLGDSNFQSGTAALAEQLRRGGVLQPQMQAYSRVYDMMQNQALTLSYIDAFWMLGVAAGAMFFLTFLLRKNNPRAPRAATLAH